MKPKLVDQETPEGLSGFGGTVKQPTVGQHFVRGRGGRVTGDKRGPKGMTRVTSRRGKNWKCLRRGKQKHAES